jgi:hypothetical protein
VGDNESRRPPQNRRRPARKRIVGPPWRWSPILVESKSKRQPALPLLLVKPAAAPLG